MTDMMVSQTMTVQDELVAAIAAIPTGTAGATELLVAATKTIEVLDRHSKLSEVMADRLLDPAAKLAIVEALLRKQ